MSLNLSSFSIFATKTSTLFLAGALVAAATSFDAKADDLIVRYDQSQLLRLPRAAAEIIIGNPSIADVTIQNGNLLVVTGKTFGITNIIALDQERNVIQDQRVIVERDETSTVNLHKAAQRQTYACTPNCSPTMTIGDESTFFETVNKHAATKTKFSDGSADAGTSQSNSQ